MAESALIDEVKERVLGLKNRKERVLVLFASECARVCEERGNARTLGDRVSLEC